MADVPFTIGTCFLPSLLSWILGCLSVSGDSSKKSYDSNSYTILLRLFPCGQFQCEFLVNEARSWLRIMLNFFIYMIGKNLVLIKNPPKVWRSQLRKNSRSRAFCIIVLIPVIHICSGALRKCWTYNGFPWIEAQDIKFIITWWISYGC